MEETCAELISQRCERGKRHVEVTEATWQQQRQTIALTYGIFGACSDAGKAPGGVKMSQKTPTAPVCRPNAVKISAGSSLPAPPPAVVDGILRYPSALPASSSPRARRRRSGATEGACPGGSPRRCSSTPLLFLSPRRPSTLLFPFKLLDNVDDLHINVSRVFRTRKWPRLRYIAI